MTSSSPFGPDTQPYWDRRHTLFSRLDEGVKLDREGLYSVKPEQIALDIAHRTSGVSVLDAFCGLGGSAIAFARIGKKVVTIDRDIQRLSHARHNARIYGVEDKIEFVHSEIFDFLKHDNRQFDSGYLDPAWGGPDYYKKEFFSLAMFSPDGNHLIKALNHRCKQVVLTVPTNFDLRELAEQNDFFFEWNFSNGRKVFATIYFHGNGQ